MNLKFNRMLLYRSLIIAAIIIIIISVFFVLFMCVHCFYVVWLIFIDGKMSSHYFLCHVIVCVRRKGMYFYNKQGH